MAARPASDDDLEMRLATHRARFVGCLVEAAEAAARRGRPLSGRLFVHDTALYAGLALRPAEASRRMVAARFLAVTLLACALCIAPVGAERPIVDLHRLDAYFALFAADSSAPWKPTTVRLDTYSSAPVAFSVYQVDPADVLTAGSNSRPRAISTAGRRPIVSFAFAPPGGYQFQSNVVNVQLGSREGFFVIEARRGDVGEQVWINRSRVGLLSKATPSGLMLYGADLGTGLPLARMRVQFVVNGSFSTMLTDNDGIVRWNRQPHPVFALAQWGGSYAFLSLLPQPPFPSTIVGVRTDSAVVHAGGTVRVVGFARTRSRGVLRAANGNVVVTLRSGARTIAQNETMLDAAGAFAASFTVPDNAASGDYTLLAQAGGGVGGATVHVDANAGGVSLDVGASCNSSCDFRQDVPLFVHASRGGVDVRVTVVRSPHVYLGDSTEDAPWATAPWLDATVRTDGSGNGALDIPRPNDDLGSTYGVHAEAAGATADTRVVVPTAACTVRIVLDHAEQSLGTPVGFDVYANELDGKPLAGATVTVELAHGSSIARQQLALDADGHARGSFASPELGTSLILASVDRGGRATDASQVLVDPQAATATTDGRSSDVRVALDKGRYRPGEDVVVEADAPGSQGEGLVTLESDLGVQTTLVKISGGRAIARLRAANAAGDVRVGAAFVRDGAIAWSTAPLTLLAAGRPYFSSVSFGNAQFTAGEAATISLDGASGTQGTVVVRISRATPSGSAVFTSAPSLLAIGVTSTQSSAPETVTWHPWVDSTGDHAQVLGFVRRTQPPEALLVQAETNAVSWSVARADAAKIAVLLPTSGGRYTISVLDISDDGSVSAGSSTLVVR